MFLREGLQRGRWCSKLCVNLLLECYKSLTTADVLFMPLFLYFIQHAWQWCGSIHPFWIFLVDMFFRWKNVGYLYCGVILFIAVQVNFQNIVSTDEIVVFKLQITKKENPKRSRKKVMVDWFLFKVQRKIFHAYSAPE